MGITILGIILFAIATIIVFSWGYIKEQKMPVKLNHKLNLKAKRLVIKVLKRNGKMTKKEIARILTNLKVSEIGTRKKLVVKDSKKFTKMILDNMIDESVVNVDYSGKEKRYYINN
ncbi:hypothetical protein [Dethiothermospora halolimnae]|uniref:hypothetical protein n=1 Tax=Dethiothermospora halolimnae TaxID=3114390 RepID=UPI003CCBCAA2